MASPEPTERMQRKYNIEALSWNNNHTAVSYRDNGISQLNRNIVKSSLERGKLLLLLVRSLYEREPHD